MEATLLLFGFIATRTTPIATPSSSESILSYSHSVHLPVIEAATLRRLAVMKQPGVMYHTQQDMYVLSTTLHLDVFIG